MVHCFESSNQHLKLTSLVVWAVILSIPKFQNHQSQTLSLQSGTWNMGETVMCLKLFPSSVFFQRNLYWKVKFRSQQGSKICQASTWTGSLGQRSSQWRYHGTVQFGLGILSLLDRKMKDRDGWIYPSLSMMTPSNLVIGVDFPSELLDSLKDQRNVSKMVWSVLDLRLRWRLGTTRFGQVWAIVGEGRRTRGRHGARKPRHTPRALEVSPKRWIKWCAGFKGTIPAFFSQFKGWFCQTGRYHHQVLVVSFPVIDLGFLQSASGGVKQFFLKTGSEVMAGDLKGEGLRNLAQGRSISDGVVGSRSLWWIQKGESFC